MKKTSLLDDYLSRYAADEPWKIYSGSLEKLEQVVVIPAFAENHSIFKTLSALSHNDQASLQDTLILCIINNKAKSPKSVKEDNAQTLHIMKTLIDKKPVNQIEHEAPDCKSLCDIADSSLRLACVDASSPGMEIPEREGGVGMARKIGMDRALRILARSGNSKPALIFSLDADTLVRPDYLSAVRSRYASKKMHTGVIAYAHQLPSEKADRVAILSYEIFLRYWVLGLQYAGSPYAFHSIGSTIVTTTDDYLGVRGMNRRAAGEDFYFLNKLAKTGSVGRIDETVVYPSGRISARVPFGTGAAVGKIILGEQAELQLYDPRVFIILKEWMALMRQSYGYSSAEIINRAGKIDSGLALFLRRRGFASVWQKISANVRNEKSCLKNFHHWFDGFETLKLVNELTREAYPRVNRHCGIKTLLGMMDLKLPGGPGIHDSLTTADHMMILTALRKWT